MLTHNEIYENALHGIDLASNGRTANDADDSDTGPNALLNFPVVTRVAKDTASGMGRLVVAIQAAPSTTYALELFNLGVSSRPAGYDATGSILRANVTTDASGAAVYENIGAPNAFDPGDSIVATLTDEANHYTSEISDPFVVLAAISINGTIITNGSVPVSDAAVSLTGTESRVVLTDSGGNYQFFDVASGGSYTVTPVTSGYTWAPTQRTFANLTTDVIADFDGLSTPATYTVNVTHDNGAGWCSVAECTLADAIYEASVHPGADRIHFAIPGAGPHVIELDWVLDVESDLIIDGYTQPGATPNTNVTGGLNGSLQIVLAPSPSAPTGFPALDITGNNVTVRGLVFAGFELGAAVSTFSGGGMGVTFEGNYFGTTPDGTAAAGGALVGILTGGPVDVTIGGTTPSARNLISGHMSTGILTTPDAPSVLRVMGNLIGTNAAGTSAIPNAVGIVHTGDAVTDDLVRIGGDTEAERNVISGNEDGVLMMSGSTPDRDGSDKVIAGNYIGVAADGETALGNTYNGISGCGELKMTIRRNVIAHNGESGVSLCITPTPAPYGVVVSENVIYREHRPRDRSRG